MFGAEKAKADLNQAKYLLVEADVRYLEDGKLNGQEDTAGNMPHMDGNVWRPIIDLDTGVIQDWPAGQTADVHYKVCDAGQYFLLDDQKQRIAKWGGHYVPDDILAGGDGYGDYIILEIDANGQIKDWRRPAEFEPEDWESV